MRTVISTRGVCAGSAQALEDAINAAIAEIGKQNSVVLDIKYSSFGVRDSAGGFESHNALLLIGWAV